MAGSYLVAPDQLPHLASECAAPLGVTGSTVYLVDYEQATLVPVHGAPGDDRPPLRVDATLAGTAFRRVATQQSESGGVVRLWVPLLDGVERLGVVEHVLADGLTADEDRLHALEQFSHVVAELLVTKSLYTDAYEWTRRREPMALAAEMQWGLLPPLTFGTSRLTISGLLAPAYEVGGDAFDYAVNGSVAHVAVFDSMGHGLGAAQLAGLAVGAYRNARRAGAPLQEKARLIDEALRDQHGGERFVTAVLGLLDLAGGHPPDVQTEALQPGDRLLLFTDGVDEARNRDGSFFGMKRLADFVAKQSASGEPTPEVMRRLQRAVLEHQGGHLQDDATTLFVEWRTGRSEQLIP